MRMTPLVAGLVAGLVLAGIAAMPALADPLKGYKLTIDGVSVDIDPGDSLNVALPDGRKAAVTLERNEFATFSGALFSFVHPSAIAVTKTDLSNNIAQYLMASALGTVVVVQEYQSISPVALNQLMLQEMTRESVQAGAALTQQPASRKLADGKELSGIRANVKTRTGSTDFEILSYGTVDQGVMLITRIDADNAKTEQPLIDKFWDSLDLKL